MKLDQLYIETDRLILRPFEERDIEPSYQLNLDEEVSKYTADGGVVSYDEIKRRIRENVMGDYAKHGYGRLAVELKSNGEFIGFSGVKYLEDLKEIELGYRFRSSLWGKGIATEAGKAALEIAFDRLQLQDLIGLVLKDNIGSIKVLEKLGFHYLDTIEDSGVMAEKYVMNIKDWNIANSFSSD